MWKWAFIGSFYGALLTSLVWSKWLDISLVQFLHLVLNSTIMLLKWFIFRVVSRSSL